MFEFVLVVPVHACRYARTSTVQKCWSLKSVGWWCKTRWAPIDTNPVQHLLLMVHHYFDRHIVAAIIFFFLRWLLIFGCWILLDVISSKTQVEPLPKDYHHFPTPNCIVSNFLGVRSCIGDTPRRPPNNWQPLRWWQAQIVERRNRKKRDLRLHGYPAPKKWVVQLLGWLLISFNFKSLWTAVDTSLRFAFDPKSLNCALTCGFL